MNSVTVKRNHLSIAPRKVRLVLGAIRNKKATVALDQLLFMDKLAAIDVTLLLKSAISAAKDKNMNEENLIISEIRADEGRSMKRRWLRARGQSTQIKKSSSHIWLTLSEKEEPKTTTKKRKAKPVVAKKVQE